jgi:inner membrane protein
MLSWGSAMSPITHFLAGWVLLERSQVTLRDKVLVVCAGLAPDLDGLGIVIDFATRSLGLPETDYYQTYHHAFGHGLPAALLFAALAGLGACCKLRVALFAFISVHLHFLCDLLGSRGNSADDLWTIGYLSPFSSRLTLNWPYQWPLVSWQNMALTGILLLLTFNAAARYGYSPLALLNRKADRAFVATIQRWRMKITGQP